MQSIESIISEHLDLIGYSIFGVVALYGIFRRKRSEIVGKKVLKKAIDSQTNEPISLHPEIDPAKCAGCGTCVSACPEGEILQIIQHKAVLVSPTKCVGHGECEVACPTGAISLMFGTKTRGMDLPRITADYETNVSGLYIAGELGGMGLIRNAVRQGAAAATHASKNIKMGIAGQSDVDILIIGAGPAGLAAALAAQQSKRTYVCIEQNSFGGTIYNFPRQKVVMSAPAELPIVGRMKFKKNKVSKEELLEYWNDIRRNQKLRIQEKTRFDGMKIEGGIFHVSTNQGLIRAKKVILSMGVRGSPRKLGLPNEDSAKVTYNLIDPEQYQRKNIAVVGGGNAGVEAAQYLGNPKYGNKVTLLCRGPTFDRCNDENKRIIEQMASKKQVEIWYNASVAEIQPTTIKVLRDGKETQISNDYLFVFAGAEMPHKFLMSLGIQIEKKFGEALRKKAS